MPVDVEGQLASYGSWLEAHCGVTLAPDPPPVPDEPPQDVDLAADGADDARSRRWLWAAAAVIIVIGVTGVTLMTRQSEPPAWMSPTDPPGALFVLPIDPTVEVTGGYITTPGLEGGTSFDLRQHALLVGRPADGGYDDPVAITSTAEIPMTFTVVDDTDLSETSRNGLRTITFAGPLGFTSVTQHRGDWWITVVGDRARVDAVLDAVSVDASGTIDADALQGVSIVYDSSVSDAGPAGVESTQVAFDVQVADDQTVTVQTTSGNPLAVLGGGFDRLEPTTVAGVEGWRIIRADELESWVGFLWQASPNRLIGVSGSTDEATIRGVAEQLAIVPEAEWKARLPLYHQED